jgi:hypothetical protein
MASMSPAEIHSRLRQEISKGSDLVRYRLLGDLHPKIKSEASGPGRFFFAHSELPEIVSILKRKLPSETSQILARAEKICAHRFDLLGYESLDYGSKIDWHLDRVSGKQAPRKPWFQVRYLDYQEVGDAKVIWELNRHQHLVTLAKAYAISNDRRFVDEIVAQWYDWRAENPYPIGINWASSLEVSFRALSWLWVKRLIADSLPKGFQRDLIAMLGISARHLQRYLSTFFSPNTHLLGEGVGLFFTGVLCPELSSAHRWKKLGWKIILQESQRQVLPDGMHFEQATYYHVYALDFFLHAALLAARNDIAIPTHLEKAIERMLDALLTVSQAGVAPRFGDDDGGRVFDSSRNRAEHMFDPFATGAVLFGRKDFRAAADRLREETVWLVGPEGVARFEHIQSVRRNVKSAALSDSGLYVMTDGAPNPVQLIVDAGPQGVHGAGHGHADALSIQLSRAGKFLLSDPGTAIYVGPDQTRDELRSTAAHNTVDIDGLSQSTPRGPFAWTRLPSTRLERWIQTDNFDFFVACHDGFSPIIHRRSIFRRKGEFWIVRDAVEGTGEHRVACHWLFGPGIVLGVKGNQVLFGGEENKPEFGVIFAEGTGIKLESTTQTVSPSYGRKESAKALRLQLRTSLPFDTAALLTSQVDVATSAKFKHTEAPEGSLVQGYVYETAEDRSQIFFRSGTAKWSLGDWSSDAELLYVREQASSLVEMIFCKGSFVSFCGRKVVTAARPVESCELAGPKGTIFSKQETLLTVHHWPTIGPPAKSRVLEPVAVRSEK